MYWFSQYMYYSLMHLFTNYIGLGIDHWVTLSMNQAQTSFGGIILSDMLH